ncbi:MAG: hypothetical protein HY764_00190 [Candidatus Portnoybacteria bacterium]|nr:hypothetical protein [Candidatus Portnoybacteria bacterium]
MNRSPIPTKDEIVGLIPFYFDPLSSDYLRAIKKLKKVIHEIGNYAGKLVVVDDGANLDKSNFPTTDLFIRLNKNKGKAEAVRRGLKRILNSGWKIKYIIQIDGDNDYPPSNIPNLLKKIGSIRESSKPIMVIGDRYPEELKKINVYRKNVLLFGEEIAATMGYRARDLFAGLRVYNNKFAEKFLKLSKSERYGLEFEQLIIAFLSSGSVFSVFLAKCRPRNTYTLKNKILQNFRIPKLYGAKLKAKGLHSLVSASNKIVSEMETGSPAFNLIFNGRILNFIRKNNGYTLID